MSMLVDVFLDERDARTLTLECEVALSVATLAMGQCRLSIDDRAVNRWVFGRGSEVESRCLERLFDLVGSISGARVVIDRGVGRGSVSCQIKRCDVGLAHRILGVLTGDDGGGCGVVEFVIVG